MTTLWQWLTDLRHRPRRILLVGIGVLLTLALVLGLAGRLAPAQGRMPSIDGLEVLDAMPVDEIPAGIIFRVVFRDAASQQTLDTFIVVGENALYLIVVVTWNSDRTEVVRIDVDLNADGLIDRSGKPGDPGIGMKVQDIVPDLRLPVPERGRMTG